MWPCLDSPFLQGRYVTLSFYSSFVLIKIKKLIDSSGKPLVSIPQTTARNPSNILIPKRRGLQQLHNKNKGHFSYHCNSSSNVHRVNIMAVNEGVEALRWGRMSWCRNVRHISSLHGVVPNSNKKQNA